MLAAVLIMSGIGTAGMANEKAVTEGIRGIRGRERGRGRGSRSATNLTKKTTEKGYFATNSVVAQY